MFSTADGGSSTISTVGRRAFGQCSKMTGTVTISKATTIGESAFYGCNNSDLTIQLKNLNNAAIGKYAFSGLTNTTINISGTISNAGENAFYNCQNMTGTITLSNATNIGEYAFKSCNNTGLNINATLDNAEIGEAAFWLSSLKSISGTAASIGITAFQDLSGVTGSLSIDRATSIGTSAFDTFTSSDFDFIATNLNNATIGDFAFRKCSIKSLNMSGTVSSIGKWAFRSCSTTSGNIEFRSVSSIGEYAFYQSNCSGRLTLSSGVNTIGQSAFIYCTTITDIYSLAATPQTLQNYTMN